MDPNLVELIPILQTVLGDLKNALDFQMGTSSSFSKLSNSVASNIIPSLSKFIQIFNDLYKDKVSISFQNENERQKSDLFQNAFSVFSTYLSKFKGNHEKLAQHILALFCLLIQSETDNIAFYELIIKLRKRNQSLQNALSKKEYESNWIKENLQQLLTIPTYFLNAKESLDLLKQSSNDSKAIQIQELKNENQQLKDHITELIDNTNKTIEDQKEEINRMTLEIELLNETVSNQKAEKEKMEKEIRKLNDRILFNKQEMADKKAMQKAINDLCDNFSFIKFNGTSFDYETDPKVQSLFLEKTLDMTRTENVHCQNEIKQLKREVEDQRKKYEKEKESLVRSNKYKIDRLNLELEQLKNDSFSSIENHHSYKLQIEDLTNENKTLKKKLNELLKQHEQLYQEIKSKEQIKIENQGQPDILAFFNSSILNTADADTVYKEANERLQKERNQLIEENEKKDQQNQQNQQKVKELEKENQDLQTQLNEANQKLQKEKEKNTKWKQFTDQIINDQNILDSNRQIQSDDENDHYKTRISELEAEIQTMKENFKEGVKTLANDYDHKITNLNEQLKEKQAEIQTLNETINKSKDDQSNEKQTENKTLNEEIERLNQQIQMLEKCIEKHNSEKQQETNAPVIAQSSWNIVYPPDHPPEQPDYNPDADINYIEPPHEITPPEIDEPSIGESRDIDDDELVNANENDQEQQANDEHENVVNNTEEHEDATDTNHEVEHHEEETKPTQKPVTEQNSHPHSSQQQNSRSQYARNKNTRPSRYNSSQSDKGYKNTSRYTKRSNPNRKK